MKDSATRSCVLLSGGIDSAALLSQLLAQEKTIFPIFVRSGFLWEAAEIFWIRRLLRALGSRRIKPLIVVDMPMAQLYGSHWGFTGKGIPGYRSDDSAVFLPGRNAVLLTAASIIASRLQAGSIYLGILKGNPFGDAKPRFFRQLQSALSLAMGQPFTIQAPFRNTSKHNLIKQIPALPFSCTFSCIQPKLRYYHCGRCNKCAERKKAFRLSGVADPTQYIR